MLAYFSVLILLYLLALPNPNWQSGRRQLIAILTLLLFGGFRSQVGSDWDAYEGIFESVGAGTPFYEIRQEDGFLLLNYISFSIWNSYELFILIVFSTALFLKIFAIKLFKADLNIALMLYFSAIYLMYDSNGLRQGLAIGFILLAGFAALKRRYYLFFSLVFVGASMHFAAVIGIPLLVMSRKIFYVKNIFLRLIILILGCLFAYYIASIIPSSNFGGVLASAGIGEKYDAYMNIFNKSVNIFGPGLYQRIVLILIIFFYIDSMEIEERKKNLLYNASVTSIIIYIIFSFNAEFMLRISYYYRFFDLITISIIIFYQNSIMKRFIFITFLFIICVGQVYSIMSIEDGKLIPYNNLIFR